MFSINAIDHPDMIVNKQDVATQTLYEDETGILLLNHKTGIAMADATSEESSRKIISIMEEMIQDVVVRGDILLHQLQTSSFNKVGKGYHFVSFQEDPKVHCHYVISHKKLDETFIDTVCKYYSYKDLANSSYISQVLKDGMIGAFYQDKLLGFIGQHDTGSIGLLEVLPQYQHHGVAQSLLKEMITYRKVKGILPYGEVLVDNDVSKSLLMKMGYSCNQKIAYWFSNK